MIQRCFHMIECCNQSACAATASPSSDAAGGLGCGGWGGLFSYFPNEWSFVSEGRLLLTRSTGKSVILVITARLDSQVPSGSRLQSQQHPPTHLTHTHTSLCWTPRKHLVSNHLSKKKSLYECIKPTRLRLILHPPTFHHVTRTTRSLENVRIQVRVIKEGEVTT